MVSCGQNKLYQDPSSPVSSLQEQLDTCPAQANLSSLPQKPSCSRLHFPLCGVGGSGGSRLAENQWQSLWEPSLNHRNPNSGAGSREAHPPHPHLGQGQRKPSWGQVASPRMPMGRWTYAWGLPPPAPSLHMRLHTTYRVHWAPFTPKSLN